MDFGFGFAVKTLPDHECRGEDRRIDGFATRVVKRDLDDEGHGTIVSWPVWHVKTLGHAQAIVEREFGDLRVRQKRKVPFDLIRKNRALAIA
jgi:hypothetical protein